MTDWPLLSVVTFIPLVCVLFLLPIKDDTEIGRRNIRQVALLGTTATFIMSLLIWANLLSSAMLLPLALWKMPEVMPSSATEPATAPMMAPSSI